jgi:murein L,D-transpeptidase YafK
MRGRSLALVAAAGLAAAAASLPIACATGARGQDVAATLRSHAVVRLHLDKSEHRLDAFATDGRVLASYRVAIGTAGLGPKRSEGEGRTPEGRYRIDRRHRSAAFHRFLHVSYPNRDDRAAFARLRRDGTLARTATIGGAIGIHGTGGSLPAITAHGMGIDWTAGCIAVTNDEAETLYRTVRPDAPLEIVP